MSSLRPDETPAQAADRRMQELLQELRVIQTGVQVLFAFLLGVPFTPRFDQLGHAQRDLYFATLLVSGVAIVLLLAPVVWHRWLFELHDKTHLVAISHRFTFAGVACVGLSVIGVVALVSGYLFDNVIAIISTAVLAGMMLVLWVALPLARRIADLEPQRRAV